VNRIREIREGRGKIVPSAFTSVAVAHRVGVSDRTLRSWESGVTRPSERHARRLAKELGVSVAELQLDERAPEDDAMDGIGDHAAAEPEP
jgi:transcriptional regulator with XRE-family HTH domain